MQLNAFFNASWQCRIVNTKKPGLSFFRWIQWLHKPKQGAGADFLLPYMVAVVVGVGAAADTAIDACYINLFNVF